MPVGTASDKKTNDPVFASTTKGFQWGRHEATEIGIEEDGNELVATRGCVFNTARKSTMGTGVSQRLLRANHRQFIITERFSSSPDGRGGTLESVFGAAERSSGHSRAYNGLGATEQHPSRKGERTERRDP